MYEDLFETMKSCGAEDLRKACRKAMLHWKDIPVEPLLMLKEQFHRLEMEDRESNMDEALISIAEKRSGPFTEIAAEPIHPLWRPAVEVLSMVGWDGYLDLFTSFLPLCPEKNLPYLIRAIGRYNSPKAVAAIAPYLTAKGDGVFFEVLLAMKRIGGPEALKCLKEGLEAKRREGSEMMTVLEVVVREMEGGA